MLQRSLPLATSHSSALHASALHSLPSYGGRRSARGLGAAPHAAEPRRDVVRLQSIRERERRQPAALQQPRERRRARGELLSCPASQLNSCRLSTVQVHPSSLIPALQAPGAGAHSEYWHPPSTLEKGGAVRAPHDLQGASPTAMLQAEHAERGDEVVAASVQLGGGGGGEAPDVIPAPSPVPRISTRQRNGSSGSLHGSRAASPPLPVLAHPGAHACIAGALGRPCMMQARVPPLASLLALHPRAQLPHVLLCLPCRHDACLRLGRATRCLPGIPPPPHTLLSPPPPPPRASPRRRDGAFCVAACR